MLDLFPLFVVDNLLDEVVPHVVHRAEHNKEGRQAEDCGDRQGDVSEVEMSVRGPAVDRLQGLDQAQLVQLAGQGPGGGQELGLGETDEVAQSSPVLQQN